MGWKSFTEKFNTHATGTLDPPEVRNARIHWVALVASMSALASALKRIDLPTSTMLTLQCSGL